MVYSLEDSHHARAGDGAPEYNLGLLRGSIWGLRDLNSSAKVPDRMEQFVPKTFV